jgi:predicted TIM-barrel fold metal-dependent hydrolase
MRSLSEKLLDGSIDMHAHAYPEYTLSVAPRLPNLEWAAMAKEYGMRAFVMKSHVWPTVAQTYDIAGAVEGITVFGSITLNYTVGGLNPVAVAIAGELGAKVVFMPTWSAKNDIEKSGLMASRISKIYPHLGDYLQNSGGGLTILDGNCKVKGEVLEILDIAKHYSMCVASSHLGVEESLNLAEVAAAKSVTFSLTHPYNRTVGATVEQQRHVAETGGYVEHCLITCMPMHMRADIKEIAKAITAVGVAHVVFSTDAIGSWNPPAPELMRMTIESLLQLGFNESEVSAMVRENPAKLLHLDT